MPTLDDPAPALWPAHLQPGAFRWVRSSSHYDDAVVFYRELVGLPVIDSFRASYGEDGTIFGLPGVPTHLEIVRSDRVEAAVDPFDQIVFYLDDEAALTRAIEPLISAGFQPDAAPHPYWRANGGVVFHDPDGRGVVYAPWVYGRTPQPVDAVRG
jgi:hypothetical protein